MRGERARKQEAKCQSAIFSVQEERTSFRPKQINLCPKFSSRSTGMFAHERYHHNTSNTSQITSGETYRLLPLLEHFRLRDFDDGDEVANHPFPPG